MPDCQSVFGRLAAEDIGEVRRNELLRDHCTWRIGGQADLLVQPRRAQHISRILQLVAEVGTPLVTIGDGSNLLFDDEGVRGVVMRIGHALSGFEIKGTRIRAQAGVWVPRLARAAGNAGLTGLEHTAGIPGTLGGLIFMNGGSRRRCVGEVVRSVDVVERDGRMRTLPAEECRFSYRHSAFQTSGAIIVAAELQCSRAQPRRIRAEMLGILRERRRKFPLDQPNSGSIFTSRPERDHTVGPPKKLIEDLGLKGLRIGDAQVSAKHANFIVNLGGATSADVLELIRRLRAAIFEKAGFWIECEVRYVQPAGRVVPAHEACQLAQPRGTAPGMHRR